MWPKKQYDVSQYYEETHKSYTWDRTRKLDYEDVLYDCLKKYGERVTSHILYLLLYAGDFSKIFSNTELTRWEKYCILSIIKQLKGKNFLNKEMEELPEFSFNTIVDRAKFLSFLEGYNSDLLVCLLLMHNQSDFMQFLVLFGGKTVRVPTLAKFMEEIRNYKEKEGTYSTSKYFVSEVQNEQRTIASSLAGFLETGYGILLEKYESFLTDLVDKADVKDPESLFNIYRFFHAELGAQARLLESSAEYSLKMNSLPGLEKLIGGLQKKEKSGKVF